MDQYKAMFEAAVKALAEIDYALGVGDDGCNDLEGTLFRIAELKGEAFKSHPAELTDEEIVLKLAEESGFMLVSSHPNDMAFPIYEASQDAIETFARAILRKAQEND